MIQTGSQSPTLLHSLAVQRNVSRLQLPSKQTREAICGLEEFTYPFTIRPHPDSTCDEPIEFKPVRVIPRSQLPLTCLDVSSESLHSNRLFSARIVVLESDEASKQKTDRIPKVLIARHKTKKTLYAIERVQAHVYSVCKLAACLNESEVSDLWHPSNWSMSAISSLLDTSANGEWWQHAAVVTQPSRKLATTTRTTMMRLKTVQTTAPQDLHKAVNTPGSEVLEYAGQAFTHISREAPIAVPSAQEQLATLLQNYLDTVYLSKTSLAYFAKGPITRVRNFFTSTERDSPSTHELTTFLRSMLPSPKASEKKFYDGIPAIVKAMPLSNLSDEEPMDQGVESKASRKKMKLNREGMYPHEKPIIEKWWKSELSNVEEVGPETLNQRIKRRIGDLRVRETLTQLIIILEIIALEATSVHKPPLKDVSSLGKLQAPTLAKGDSSLEFKKREKKLNDINLQLDLLLDKLCIWHVTEEAGILDFDTKQNVENECFEELSKNSTNDRLHSFCVEVIIPFYMNRLPEQALMVNKKLGGPAHTSPPKRKALKPPNTSHKLGELQAIEPKKSRRSLTTAAVNCAEGKAERTTPSLNRCVTDSALLNGIKQEGGEVPLPTMSFQRKNARQSMTQIKHLQGRQIDLSQPSATATVKIKQKQRVEEDLQEAISALRKPNRGLVAGGYMADMERRRLGPASKCRKPANPVRRMVKDIQVQATPRHDRKAQKVMEQTPSRHDDRPVIEVMSAESLPMNGIRIPSSIARLPVPVVPSTVQYAGPIRKVTHWKVAETPSKAPQSKSFTSGSARRRIFTSPSKMATSLCGEKLQLPLCVMDTPSKTANTDLKPLEAASIPCKLRSVSATTSSVWLGDQERSIYDALGWDDIDHDDALL